VVPETPIPQAGDDQLAQLVDRFPCVGSFRHQNNLGATENFQSHQRSNTAGIRCAVTLFQCDLALEALRHIGENSRGPDMQARSVLGRPIWGRVVRLDPGPPKKVPHVGWNRLSQIAPHPLFKGVKPHVDFYFVHSYHCVPSHAEDIAAVCDFAGNFVAAVAKGNVAGMQFHPEKSQPSGMRILENFADWEPEC